MKSSAWAMTLSLSVAAPGCVANHKRERAEAAARELDGGTPRAAAAGPFAVTAAFYHPTLLPFEGFVRQLGRGEMSGALEALDWRYVPSNVEGELIEDLLDAGILPALVRVQNTGAAPASMAALLLGAETASGRGAAIPNDAIPAQLSVFDAKAFGANVTDAVVTTALVVGVLATFYVAASQAQGSKMGNLGLKLVPNVRFGNVAIGAGSGVLCPGGVPQSYDGKPFTNAEASAFASSCWKQQTGLDLTSQVRGRRVDRKLTKIKDLDYERSLLRYRVLQPGESAVGLQLFRMSGAVADWQALKLTAQEAPIGATALAARAWDEEGAVVSDAGWFKGERGVRLDLPFMPAAQCGWDKETGRVVLSFRDTYGDSKLTQKLRVTLDAKGLPAAGETFTFDANDSRRSVELFLSAELGELNGAWRSSVAFAKSSRCSFVVTRSEKAEKLGRTLGEGGVTKLYDRFLLAGDVACERVADYDSAATRSWLKFSGKLACSGPWTPSSVLSARHDAAEPAPGLVLDRDARDRLAR